jgi:hypothetical protein
MLGGKKKEQAFFRIESIHESQSMSHDSPRESMEAWYSAAVCEKNIFHTVRELGYPTASSRAS